MASGFRSDPRQNPSLEKTGQVQNVHLDPQSTQSTHVWLLRRVIYVGTAHVNADIPRICVVHQSRHRMRKRKVRRLPPAQTHSVTVRTDTE